jgi:hypothetical protein
MGTMWSGYGKLGAGERKALGVEALGVGGSGGEGGFLGVTR